MTGSNRLLLTGILVFALALRVGVAFAWQPALAGDAEDYHRLASGLAAGRGYVNTLGQPTAWRPPRYPAFLAGVYVVVGDAPAAVGLIQAAVGTASVAAVFAVTAPVLGATAGLVAAALVAVDAAQLSLTAQRMSEGLFTLLLLLLVLSSLRLRARLLAGAPPWGWAVGAGVLGGVATLTRGLFVGYPLALAVALVAEGGRDGRPVRSPSSRPSGTRAAYRLRTDARPVDPPQRHRRWRSRSGGDPGGDYPVLFLVPAGRDRVRCVTAG